MKVSVSNGVLFGLVDETPQGVVKAFTDTGFRHFDFNFDPFFYLKTGYHGSHFEQDMTDAADTAKKLGFDFPMAHSAYRHNPCQSGEDFDAQVRDTRQCILGCHLLGIDRMTVHAGFGFSENIDAMLETNRRYYEALLPIAEQYGIVLMIENIAEEIYQRAMVVEDADRILQLKELLGKHPLIRACWDTGHANIKSFVQYQELKKLGSELFALHIQDNNGKTDDHMPPLFGTVNFDEILTALQEINYRGPFNLEAHFLNAGNQWPNFRKHCDPVSTKNALFNPDPFLRKKSVAFMFDIAAYMLKKYDFSVE